MKDLFEQLEEMSAKLADLKAFAEANASSEFESCCDGECECNIEEKVILRRGEVVEAPEDEGPEFDGAGFAYGDRVVDGQYMVTSEAETEIDPYVAAAEAQMIVFTRAELIDFATRLTARVIISAKEAVTDTSIDADDLVSLELNAWSGNTIDIELDKDKLIESIHSEIDDTINVDSDSIEDEITDILGEIYSEVQS
jgi:hypothetical protein